LAVGTSAGTIHLWDLATGKEVRDLKGHREDVSSLVFSADGSRLASGSRDTTVLTWDVSNSSDKPSAVKLTAKELEALWADLTEADAAKAYRAIQALVTAPEQSVPFLGKHVRPGEAPDPKRLARLIADLDADEFAVRDNATTELEKLGPLARPALREVLAGRPSVEVRQRVNRLLEKPDEFAQNADTLRNWRAIEVLELLGTPAAREVLGKLAEGPPGAWLTEDARAAVQRLSRRPQVIP
jgi:hypothetical protein